MKTYKTQLIITLSILLIAFILLATGSSILTKSLGGLDVLLLTINIKNISKSNLKKRKYIIINARTHPGETSSSWVLDGVLDSLVRDDSIIEWM